MSMQSSSLRRCQSFIDSNFVEPPPQRKQRRLALAISRQTYSRTHEMSEELIRLLNRDTRLGRAEWALFDRDLVHKILEDHNLPRRMARYMPEDKDREVSGLISEILGLHPSLWELFHYTCSTIHKLAEVGNVILIGRGAHIITRDLDHVFHVRVIAPMQTRVQNASHQLGISREQASRTLLKEDQASAAYIRQHFNEHLENPLAYHVTLNLGKIGPAEGAGMLHELLQRC